MNEERLQEIVLEEAYRAIPITDQGKTVSIPLAQAVVRSLAVNAAKGNTRAQHLFTEMLRRTEKARSQLQTAFFETAVEFKLQWEREFARCDKLGIPRPEVIPHPDDVIVDPRAGTVRFTGPITKEEKDELDFWVAKITEFETQLRDLRSDIERPENQCHRDSIQEDITFTENLLDKLTLLAPDD